MNLSVSNGPLTEKQEENQEEYLVTEDQFESGELPNYNDILLFIVPYTMEEMAEATHEIRKVSNTWLKGFSTFSKHVYGWLMSAEQAFSSSGVKC